MNPCLKQSLRAIQIEVPTEKVYQKLNIFTFTLLLLIIMNLFINFITIKYHHHIQIYIKNTILTLIL